MAEEIMPGVVVYGPEDNLKSQVAGFYGRLRPRQTGPGGGSGPPPGVTPVSRPSAPPGGAESPGR